MQLLLLGQELQRHDVGIISQERSVLEDNENKEVTIPAKDMIIEESCTHVFHLLRHESVQSSNSHQVLEN